VYCAFFRFEPPVSAKSTLYIAPGSLVRTVLSPVWLSVTVGAVPSITIVPVAPLAIRFVAPSLPRSRVFRFVAPSKSKLSVALPGCSALT